MRLFSDSKIYIFCPGNYHTGGIELLHQLCSEMIILGLDAYMVYYPGAGFNKENPVDDFYRKYHLPYMEALDDNPHNIVITNENDTQYLYVANKVQKVLWWLSVDNYLKGMGSRIMMYASGMRNLTANPVMRFFTFSSKESENIEHWVQSEYARQFLKVNLGVDANVKMVGDYLNQEFFKESLSGKILKKDMIVYNPKKGMEYTARLIDIAKDLNWVPIENMTTEEVRNCLSNAKVYIDFGNHPGKDRIPREAAMSGCVVITGKKGAAANDIDICIDSEFKFDENRCSLMEIISKIKDVFDNYEHEFAKQEKYRQSIRDERSRFSREVALALGLPVPREDVAIIAEFNDYEYLLNAIKRQSKNLMRKIYVVNDKIALAGNIQSPAIVREKNVNKLRLSNGEKLEFITLDDAAFLYKEGRIKRIAYKSDKAEIVAKYVKKTEVSYRDCLEL